MYYTFEEAKLTSNGANAYATTLRNLHLATHPPTIDVDTTHFDLVGIDMVGVGVYGNNDSTILYVTA